MKRPSNNPHPYRSAAKKRLSAPSTRNFLPYSLMPQAKASFPPNWAPFFDTEVTSYVKRKYSPQEKWKDKPFSSADIHFFKKGVRELSDIFTVERDRRINTYFQHPKFRSSYLLYFLPLHAAKFYILFQQHKTAVTAQLEELAKKAQGGEVSLVVRDFGSGPGTATIAFLLFLSQLPPALRGKLRVRMELWDQNADILKDGAELISRLLARLKLDPGYFDVRTLQRNWTDFAKRPEPTDLIFFGNVLNEGFVKEIERIWLPLLSEVSPLGLLFVEPSTRKNSQLLSRLREDLLKTSDANPVIVRGPCLHQGSCPLLGGRDWCHFSVPAEIPGRWFKEISGTLGSERMWSKMSYLWIYRPEKNTKPVTTEEGVYKVVSDAFNHNEHLHVLLCTPGTPEKLRVSLQKRPRRGDLLRLRRK